MKNRRRIKIGVALAGAFLGSFALTQILLNPLKLGLISQPGSNVDSGGDINRSSGWFEPLRNYPTPQPSKRKSDYKPPASTPYPTEGYIVPRITLDLEEDPPGSGTTAVPPGRARSELFTLINNQRRAGGKRELKFHAALNKAAQRHAETTTGCSHIGPQGSTLEERVREAGYPGTTVGENIACGAGSAGEALDMWKRSSSHWQNLLYSQWRSAGIGVSRGYWVFIGGTI